MSAERLIPYDTRGTDGGRDKDRTCDPYDVNFLALAVCPENSGKEHFAKGYFRYGVHVSF